MYKINSESIGDVKKYIWHYRKDNKEYGPFTYEDIVEMVREGVIGPEDYVLKFGNRKFVQVSEVQGLSEVQGFSEVKGSSGEEEPSEEEVSSEEEITPKTIEKPEETKEEQHEEIKHVAYDNRSKYIQGKHKKESLGQKMPVVIACIVGLCFIAVLWILLS